MGNLFLLQIILLKFPVNNSKLQYRFRKEISELILSALNSVTKL